MAAIDRHKNKFVCLQRTLFGYGTTIAVFNKQNELFTKFSVPYDNIHGICIDSDGQIYIRGVENVHVYAFEIQ